MKRIVSIMFLVSVLVLVGCQPSGEESAKGKTQSTKASELKTTDDGMPIAEKGITVVNKDGWTDQQMDFQIGYCVSTVSNLTNLNGLQFCECFLNRIQYYYEPRFAKEAYEDQAKWNQECFEAATIE